MCIVCSGVVGCIYTFTPPTPPKTISLVQSDHDLTVLYRVKFVSDLYSVREDEKAMVQLCIEDPMVKQCG